MASANAIFWTSAAWDGSEEMAAQSVHYCAMLPRSSHRFLPLGEFLKTAIVALQGVQAVYVFTGALTGSTRMPRFAVDTLFSAIAFLGLVRLPVAFWLTSDYVYAIPVRTNSADDVIVVPLSSSNTTEYGERDDDNGLLSDKCAGTRLHRRRPTTFWLPFMYIAMRSLARATVKKGPRCVVL